MSETPLRLLLVEDSADDAALLLHVLRRERYQVQCRRVETGPGRSNWRHRRISFLAARIRGSSGRWRLLTPRRGDLGKR